MNQRRRRRDTRVGVCGAADGPFLEMYDWGVVARPWENPQGMEFSVRVTGKCVFSFVWMSVCMSGRECAWILGFLNGFSRESFQNEDKDIYENIDVETQIDR